MIKRWSLAAGAAAALAGCVAPREAPPPVAAPRPAPPIVRPANTPPPPPREWRDAALTPGDWRYSETPGGSEAVFAGAFSVRCDAGSRQLVLTRLGAGAGPMIVRTTFGARSFSGASAPVPASDRFLDSLVFSRGRFSVEAPGTATLIVPAWPEPARVLEDCRG